ncbi:MAG TPA: hypothetical protein VMZ30_13180 [Pyrinomonadaceae bacterium]|nr:hypothetical protein [Pyrinomonadaceae bacterium]
MNRASTEYDLPTAEILFVLIRAFRVHPRPIFVTYYSSKFFIDSEDISY